MRHLHIKPNSGSKSNVGSSSGTKVTNASQKAGATKRIVGESVRNKKKRKLSDSPSKVKGTPVQKHPKESDPEKTKKASAAAVKKARVNVKKLKKSIEKSKKVNVKLDKKANILEKVLKRCKNSGKSDENDGPPTLCETFSRITTMVAETVINEKENQRLTESLMGKVKKEADSPSSFKGKGEAVVGDAVKTKKGSGDVELPKVKTSGKKLETGKKLKPSAVSKVKVTKAKNEPKKSKLVSKKHKEKATLDNTENLVKVLKEEEISLAFGKGIGTRRKSTAGFLETDLKPETSETNKSKSEIVVKTEITRKKPVAKKVVLKKEKPKSKVGESQLKKGSEESKKIVEKGKDDQSSAKESTQKKVIPKKEQAVKTQTGVKKKRAEKSNPPSKNTKVALKDVKSPKPKLGSETDGSNSDELTLSMIQKKTKKTKTESEKSESSEKLIKRHSISEEVKTNLEDKTPDVENVSARCSKGKIKKEEKGEPSTYKKVFEIVKDKKKAKETESDTDEDMELKRIMAKKLGRSMKPTPEPKKKKVESGKSAPESEQRARRLKLFGFWTGPKRHRVASLNALAKVHCLYENESKGVLAEIEKMSHTMKQEVKKPEKKEEKPIKIEKKMTVLAKKPEKDSNKLDVVVVNKRSLRGNPGTRGAGKHWDMFAGDSTTSLSSVSSDEGQSDTDKPKEKKLPLQPSYRQKMLKKEDEEKEEVVKAPKRRRNNEIGVTMDLKDMVVRKRMASLNASAILAASYSTEKRSSRKDSSGTSTEDGMSSAEDNDRFMSDEGESTNAKVEIKKSGSDQEKSSEEKSKETEGMNAPHVYTEYRHKKHFWKTKVESLKKSSREKRNSPSPILAEFGVKKDLSTTVLEKEKNDEMNDDKEKDKITKLGYPRKYLEGRMKGKALEGKLKNTKCGVKESLTDKDDKRKYTKRKFCEEDVKNINIEKMGGLEKSDEYEYKSDSDNGQRKLIELRNTGGSNKKVAVIVNQDTDVTITGVYVNSTRSTHHEGFCSIAGMQYRISSTSHTQTEATAVLKTSTASEQTPSPSEPRICTSPRGHKSYTPLSALSNMQPPAGAPPHPHLPPPPPPHHHHHLCGMGQHRPPPDHYLGHGPISHQRPMSPLGRRHGCSSAFTAPHCSSHPAPGDPMAPADGDGFGPPLSSHGYFQPAGPLIHHHSSNSAPPPPPPPTSSIKAQNLTSLETTSTSASESQAPASANDEPAESASRTPVESSGPPPPPPPPAAHHMGYPRGYPPYQGGYYQGSYYPPPSQSAHFQPPPPPSFHQHYHHHQDLCYQPGYPPSSYPPPPGSYRRFLQPPPGYYSPELTYGSTGPPSSQDHGAQQMVVPGGASSSYSAPLDPYPPPAPYYPGYSPGPGPACYSHPPSSRNLAFIEQTYQSCPCPMQLCPKNVHTGPLTGECKRPGALPLPPVALQLPQEPPGAAGPPSPARGSAGMPPQPSPASNSARPNWDGGRNSKSSLDTKWEVSRTTQEMKPLQSGYDSEIQCGVNEKQIEDLSPGKDVVSSLDKSSCVKFADNKWIDLSFGKAEKDSETLAQGLLAISSKEMLLLTAKTQELTEPVVIERIEDDKKIKTESLGPFAEDIEPIKKTEQTARKRNLTAENTEQSPKRKKLIAKLEEILVNNLEEGRKRKRRVDSAQEDLENKVMKFQKVAVICQKDENACGDVKLVKKLQKHRNTKAKLLKDRNETVEWKERLQNGVKGSGGKKEKEKKVEAIAEAETLKITGRRKSNEDKSDIFPEAEAQSIRKSKSCSPSRSKIRENSPVTQSKEEIKRTKNGKAKVKVVSEHSKSAGKRKNCSNGSKGGKQVSCFLQKGFQTKGRKSKSEYALAVSALKKLNSRKNHSGPPRTGIAPKWSNGWSWDSESFDAKVYLTNDEPPVVRKCYTAMRHVEGDVIHPKDCILLKAGPRKIDLPFVAKVAALWENPDDGEMMVSLLWYYRPEHTDQGRQPSDQQDEIFASRHKDINSVACIEDKCFVLTYNEYCRYRKKVKRVEEGVAEKNLPVPRLEQPYFRFQRQPPCVMAPDMVFFCRRVYDFRQKRLLKNPT